MDHQKYFYKDAHAPIPSRIHIGVVVALRRDNKILFDHRADGDWGLIGGAMEIGESITECAKREVTEETGYEVQTFRLVGNFSDPSRIIQKPNHAVQLVTICFAAEAPEGELRLSDESQDAGFFTREEIGVLDVVSTHRAIVPHLFNEDQWPILA